MSPLLLFLALFGTLYGESVSYCFNILSRGSSVCQVSWSLRYCSAVMGVVLMCLLFLVMMQPVCVPYCVESYVMVMVTSTNHCAMVPHLLAELLQQILLKINHNFLQYHISCHFCLTINYNVIMLIIIIQLNWLPINYCQVPHIGWLNSSVAGLGSPGSNGVDLISSNTICLS